MLGGEGVDLGGLLKSHTSSGSNKQTALKSFSQSRRAFFSPVNSTMYIKFCQRYKGDSKQECEAKLSSHPKLCVALEGGESKGRSRLYVLFFGSGWWWCCNILLIPLADKEAAPTAGKICAYKAASIVLAVLCVLLLLATIILALKREYLQP